MKLWIRIFISILLVSLSSLFICSSYLINRNHKSNINREQDRSLNEFDFIRSAISNNVYSSASSDEMFTKLLVRYAKSYADRGIYLMIYRKDNYVFNDFNGVSQDDYKSLLSVSPADRMVRVMENDGRHYILVSGRMNLSDSSVLIYARDISSVYESRKESIRLTVSLSAALIIILGLLSLLYSKWITKPVEALKKGAISVAKGDYHIRVPVGRDEFMELAKAFNTMAAAVETTTGDLTERAQELQIFIDDLSHEMNTPLTSIQGYAELLQNANVSIDQYHKALQSIRTQAERMKDIYTRLMMLTLTREQQPGFDIVDIRDLFADIHDTFLNQLHERQIAFQTQCALTGLYADRTLLHILLGNFVKNSLQAVADGGCIQVSAYKDNNKAVLQVTDNGIGIPEDKLKDVTNPFFRVDKSRSRKTGGAGLGLSICKNIAKHHNAELIIESGYGIGTTVKVIFPS